MTKFLHFLLEVVAYDKMRQNHAESLADHYKCKHSCEMIVQNVATSQQRQRFCAIAKHLTTGGTNCNGLQNPCRRCADVPMQKAA